jgi:predicted amidohydrolase YtcJ
MQEVATRQVWKSADTANVTGEPMDGAGQGGAVITGAIYVPEERITVAEAVRAYTWGSAYAAFSDDRVGSLEVGKLADLAVLSQDIFSVPPDTIGKTHVVTTMVGGKIVYSAAAP